MKAGVLRRISKALNYPWAITLAFVIGPALLIGVPYYYLVVVGNQSGANYELFLALIGALIGVLAMGLGGARVHSMHQKRKRFRDLVSGERKSELARNWDELESLARDLPPRYRDELRKVKAELRARR